MRKLFVLAVTLSLSCFSAVSWAIDDSSVIEMKNAALISTDFPEDVLREVAAIPDQISEEEIQKRRDLRNLKIFTIDGDDAKDLDDAISVEELPNGHYRLGVHIADVGHYVKEGSSIDKEAYRRGTSVYLVDHVIPMLPRRLSNGICSLNPKVDRLTQTCDMEIDAQGNIVNHEIYLSVIRTKERMTYNDVKKILVDQDPTFMERYEPFVEDFQLMARLAEILNHKRVQKGAIDFNFSEAKMIVDDEGNPLEIVKRPRTVAERLIEEFMLAANEVIAKHYRELGVPFVYRIHDNPNPQKLRSLFTFATKLGYAIKGTPERITSKNFQEFLTEISGKKEEKLLSSILLRAMAKGRYSTDPIGHYGLATSDYCHFTSPIRRYPDLLIHRIIREIAEKGSLSKKRMKQLNSFLPDAVEHSSKCERAATSAERNSIGLKKAEFMAKQVDQEYEGTISGVTSFGFFVQLSNTVEGLVHVRTLKEDWYEFKKDQYALIGKRKGHMYRLGDPVRVKVSNVDVKGGKINFALLDHEASQKVQKMKKQKSKRKHAA